MMRILNDMKTRVLSKIFVYAPIGIMGILAGLCVAFTLVVYREYTRVKSDLTNLRGHGQRLMQRSLLMYGDVASVDVQNSTISVWFRNQFIATEDPVLLLLHVGATTTIAREDLIATDGVYTALSEAVPESLANIIPGMRVAVMLENRPEVQRIEARVILFGNPL